MLILGRLHHSVPRIHMSNRLHWVGSYDNHEVVADNSKDRAAGDEPVTVHAEAPVANLQNQIVQDKQRHMAAAGVAAVEPAMSGGTDLVATPSL